MESQHGGTATFVQAVPVHEVFEGKTVWDGVVHVFDLAGHPTANRAYAWSYEREWQAPVLCRDTRSTHHKPKGRCTGGYSGGGEGEVSVSGAGVLLVGVFGLAVGGAVFWKLWESFSTGSLLARGHRYYRETDPFWFQACRAVYFVEAVMAILLGGFFIFGFSCQYWVRY